MLRRTLESSAILYLSAETRSGPCVANFSLLAGSPGGHGSFWALGEGIIAEAVNSPLNNNFSNVFLTLYV